MNTTVTYPIPEPLQDYFKQEFLHLLRSYAAHDKMFHLSCHNLARQVDAIGWSLDRHLVWFMNHFSVQPADYEFSYINALILRPNWETLYDDHWEEWLDKLVAPSECDLDNVLGAEELAEE